MLESPSRPVAPHRTSRAERRRLVEADRRVAALGRLAAAQAVLERAAADLGAGWVQCAFFAGPAEAEAACLVGAIVRAAGGDRDAEPAAKALGVAWSTMLGRPDDPDSSTAPMLRVLRIRELAAWNDAPGRTAGEVRALLGRSAERVAEARVRLVGSGTPA